MAASMQSAEDRNIARTEFEGLRELSKIMRSSIELLCEIACREAWARMRLRTAYLEAQAVGERLANRQLFPISRDNLYHPNPKKIVGWGQVIGFGAGSQVYKYIRVAGFQKKWHVQDHHLKRFDQLLRALEIIPASFTQFEGGDWRKRLRWAEKIRERIEFRFNGREHQQVQTTRASTDREVPALSASPAESRRASQSALREGLLIELDGEVELAPAFVDKVAKGFVRAKTSWDNGAELEGSACATLIWELVIPNVTERSWDLIELTDVTREVSVHVLALLSAVASEAALIEVRDDSTYINRQVEAAVILVVGDAMRRPFRENAYRKLLYRAFLENVLEAVRGGALDGKYTEVVTLFLLATFQDQGAFVQFANAVRSTSTIAPRKKKRSTSKASTTVRVR